MAEHAHTTTGGPPPPLELIALDDHPDRDLLLFCACLGRMRGQVEALERTIACIPAATVEGRRMKQMSL